jgi:hypothetical protein
MQYLGGLKGSVNGGVKNSTDLQVDGVVGHAPAKKILAPLEAV